MEKEVQEPAEIEVIAFDTEDVTATGDLTELPALTLKQIHKHIANTN